MAFALFSLIVISLSLVHVTMALTLNQRIQKSTDDGLFVGKLLNYSENDFDGIVATINDHHYDQFDLIPTIWMSALTLNS